MSGFNPQETTKELVTFLKKTFSSSGFGKAVIGLSGGVDSATSFALAVRTLGKEHVYPVLLPYGTLYPQGLQDALFVCDAFGIPLANRIIYDIQPMADAYILSQDISDNTRRGNVMARSRMIVLFDMAKKYNALVVGTENKSEHLLGYFTRFGDEASDIEPLRSLYKTQVYILARELGIPEPVLTKAPTAGLWDGQTDEGEFGFTYQEADQILSALYDEGKTQKDLLKLGTSQERITQVIRRVGQNAFKQSLPFINNP